MVPEHRSKREDEILLGVLKMQWNYLDLPKAVCLFWRQGVSGSKHFSPQRFLQLKAQGEALGILKHVLLE